MVRVFALVALIIKYGAFGQQCSKSNGATSGVELLQTDGSRQMFIMTKLEPYDAEHSCSKVTTGRGDNSDSENSFSFSDVTANTVKLKFAELYEGCSENQKDLPTGLCMNVFLCDEENSESCSDTMIKKYAAEIVKMGLVPLATGNSMVDSKLALGTVLLNVGKLHNAIAQFTEIIKDYPNTLAAYHGRALAYVRRGLHTGNNAQLALQDYATAVKIDEDHAETYERRAEVLLPLGQYEEATRDLEKALHINKSNRLFANWGLIHFLQRNYVKAEEDFRKSLENSRTPQPSILYRLGLSLMYRGKIRNAIEVFQDVLNLNPNNVEALFSISQSYKELGDLKKARELFNKSLTIDPAHIFGRQLRATMYYNSGLLSLALQDSQVCLSLEPNNHVCRYMEGLSYTAMGQFYPGIKAFTKLIVNGNDLPIIQATSEFVSAQYLKEYSRYLHAHLDLPVKSLNVDNDLKGEFIESWAKGERFMFTNSYREQPGLQPSINDVTRAVDVSVDLKTLVCKAEQLGTLSQVTVDGVMPNRRLNLAMGLAAIHVAQAMESFFNPTSNNKVKGNKSWKNISWKDMFSVAVGYRRLVDPEHVCLWLDVVTRQSASDGFKTEISFIKGQATNFKLNVYYDLVFKLLKTMLEHYKGDGSLNYEGIKTDLEGARTCQDLINIARKRKMNQQGFMVTTQVPSINDNKKRLEGTTIMLTEPEPEQINLILTTSSTQTRTRSYSKELDFLFSKLQKLAETRHSDVKNSEFEVIQNVILNILYMFLNLMPLSRGNISVAYATVVGLFLAMGKELQGKIPLGKLLDMEALLSGAPDAFNIVTKQWMTFKKPLFQPSSLPSVTTVLPSIRSILEVLNIEQLECPKKLNSKTSASSPVTESSFPSWC